jgi:nicotinamide-nucleotide amidase
MNDVMGDNSKPTWQTDALCSAIVRNAKERGLTVGCAESCTGGMVCSALTDTPGASAVVNGAVVSYAISVKEHVLGVPKSITRSPSIGVISEECAAKMAEGACSVLGCDIAVSITGIAGPGGAEPGKPVGTVCFGIHAPHAKRECTCHFSGNREQVRKQATYKALQLLLETI